MAKRNLREEAEYRKMQLEIAEAIQSQTQSIKSYSEAQKELLKNAKLYRQLTRDIAGAQEEINKELEKSNGIETERVQLLKSELAALEKEQKYIKELNKKLLSLKSAAKAVGNELLSWGKTLGSDLLPSFNDIFTKSQSIDKEFRNITAEMGIGASMGKVLRTNIDSVALTANGLNITTEELIKAQGAYSNEVGRSALLSQSSLTDMVHLSKALNMSVDSMSLLTGQMEAFGFGAEKSLELVREVRDVAESQGINAGKVVKKFQKNLGLLNKLDFKGGVKGMIKMAAYSEKYKISMEAIAGVSEKVFRPEGAIEAAAQLQMLGGGLSQLGDPFQLMHDARYAPEELAKSLTKAVVSSAEFNKETGEFEMNALELDRMREASAALGMNFEELVTTAKQTAKMDMFGGMMGQLSEKDRDLISGMAVMGEGGKSTVSFVDKEGKLHTKALNEMTPELVNQIRSQKENNEELAKQNQTFQEAWKGLKEQLMNIGSQFLLPLINGLLPYLQGLGEWVSSLNTFEKTIGGIGILLGPILFNVGKWLINGMMLRKGFNMGGKASDIASTVSPQSTISKKFGTKGKTPPLPSGGQTGTMGPEKMQKMGAAAKTSAKSMLAFGAAMLMIGAGIALAATGIAQLVLAFQGLTGQQALAAFGTVVALMGGMALMLYLLTTASVVAAGPLLAVGAAFLMIGGGVALAGLGISMIADSFTNMFAAINMENIGALLLLGPALVGIAGGMLLLSVAMVALGASMLLGGFLGLIALGSIAEDMQTAFSGIDAEGIVSAIGAINNADMDKINALKELSGMMAMWGMFGAKTVSMELSVDGDIELTGEGGSSVGTGWIDDPIFVSNLKDLIMQHMSKDAKGGYA